MPKLEEVFGVSAKQILSYVERADVDTKFREALNSDKQVVVYGSSKQGKTSLVSKYLPYDEHILVSLTPRTQLLDIYQTIISKVGVKILSGSSERKGSETTASISAKVRALIPIFGSGEAGTAGSITGSSGTETRYDEIPINLELPQHVCDLVKKVTRTKWVILENFHYLNDEVQKRFAFDLRSFQELGLRLVILGVWREKNKMAQFNGDLLDRLIEIPVEPWEVRDFRRVVEKGAAKLNIRISEKIIEMAIGASFFSIGVFQELLKQTCIDAGVSDTCPHTRQIAAPQHLDNAIAIKADDYASRHQRALEAIAAGHNSGGAKGDLVPLYLPYYLVRVILNGGFQGIAEGMRRSTLHENIKAIHHRGEDVRGSDMTNLLDGLANLQLVKSISPPIIDYDAQNRLLQVVDSTFYFFIKTQIFLKLSI